MLQQPDRAALWGELLQALLAFLDGQAAAGPASAAADTDAEDGDEGEVGASACTAFSIWLSELCVAGAMLLGGSMDGELMQTSAAACSL